MHYTDTGEKILQVAIELMAKKGFNAVTTKEIAKEASVSEMTLFRHFGTKKKLLEEAVDRFYYTISFKKLFVDKIVWDLEKDLLLIAKTYHELMKRNRYVIHLALKEGGNIEGLLEQVNKHPRQLKELMINYFTRMQQDKKMIECDVEMYAMSFLYMHYGLFISRSFVSGETITSLSEDEFIKNSVTLFCGQLTPQL